MPPALKSANEIAATKLKASTAGEIRKKENGFKTASGLPGPHAIPRKPQSQIEAMLIKHYNIRNGLRHRTTETSIENATTPPEASTVSETKEKMVLYLVLSHPSEPRLEEVIDVRGEV